MLSPDYLKALGEQIEIMYASLEDDIIADIVRRLMSTKLEMTQSAVWQSEVLQTTGVLRQDVISRVARATRENEKKIEQIFEEGGLETLRYDDEVYKRAGLNPLPIKQSPAMLQILIASAKKCNNEIKNLTRTSAATASTGLRRILDKAYMQVISGGFDYNTAIRRAVKQAGKEGIKVVYPSGGTAQLDVAIRRAVITGVNQTAGEIQKMRIEEMGTKLVETSAHFGARPDHAEWQGQVFYYKEPVEGYESFVDITRYGSGDGLMGWNCRHSFFPFFKGISKRAYTDDELQKMKEHTVKYNGKEYTDYKASQIQRRMEREIRATKREILALDKARNSVGISQELKDSLNSDYNMASVVLARKNEQLADFLEQTGRGEDRARLLVDGFDRSHAQASVWVARKSSVSKEQKYKDAREARSDELFYIVPPLKGDAIKAHSIFKELNKSEVGKSVLKFIEERKPNIEINYTDECPKNKLGHTWRNNIEIYAKNTQTVLKTTQTLIHEITHMKYDIGGDQWSEAVCFVQEIKHLKKELTFKDKRDIIKSVKRLYPEYNWRK